MLHIPLFHIKANPSPLCVLTRVFFFHFHVIIKWDRNQTHLAIEATQPYIFCGRYSDEFIDINFRSFFFFLIKNMGHTPLLLFIRICCWSSSPMSSFVLYLLEWCFKPELHYWVRKLRRKVSMWSIHPWEWCYIMFWPRMQCLYGDVWCSVVDRWLDSWCRDFVQCWKTCCWHGCH